MDTLITAIFLSILQGFFEFIPISSSGQVALIGNLLSFEYLNNLTFYAIIHFGSLAAVIWWTRKTLYKIVSFKSMPKNQTTSLPLGVKLFILIIIATIPLFFLLPIRGIVESALSNTDFIASMLIVNGLILFLIHCKCKKIKKSKQFGKTNALITGVSQCFAIIPGISRMSTTTVSTLLMGFDKQTAIQFSLLLSIPTLFGAGVLSIIDSFLFHEIEISLLISVFFTSFFSSLVSIWLLEKSLNKIGMNIFAIISFVIAISVFVFV